MNTQQAFQALEKKFGSHSAAARALGYTPGHYRAIRNGRIKPSDKFKKIVELLEHQTTVQGKNYEKP
jgi:hypothetical protein